MMARSKVPNGVPNIRTKVSAKGKVTYWTQITVKLPNGMSDRRYVAGNTHSACLKEAMKLLGESAVRGVVREKTVSVPQVVEAFIKRDSDGKSPQTIRMYESTYRLYVRKLLNVPAETLKKARFQSFLKDVKQAVLHDKRAKTGAGAAKTCFTTVKAALSWAASEDGDFMISRNPLEKMTFEDPAKNNHREHMPVELVLDLLEASEGRPSQIIWRILMETGARRGEILGLNRKEVDFARKRINIWKIASPESNGNTLAERTKGKTDRWIPMSDALWTALREYVPEDARPDDPLIRGPKGGRLNFSTYGDWWRRDLKAAGIPHGEYVPHQLRHTYATVALAEGVPVNVVSRILGHSSAGITFDVYGHVEDDQKYGAAAAVSARYARSVATNFATTSTTQPSIPVLKRIK
jgi:integrase